MLLMTTAALAGCAGSDVTDEDVDAAREEGRLAGIAEATPVSTLDTIHERGTMKCGVKDSQWGMGFADADGVRSGLDIEYCKAVAAAIGLDAEQDIEYILDSLKEKMTISNVLLMNNGSRLYVTATVDENEVTTGDTIKRQLHLYNSHDGSTSLGVIFTDKRMACMNELGLFTGSHAKTAIENGQGLKMKHTANVRRFAHSITRRLDLENQRFKQSIDEYKLMSNTAFNAGDCEKILLEVYGDKINNKTIQDHKYATPREKTYRDLKEYRDIVNLTQYGQGLSLTNGETVYKFFYL